MLEATGSEPLSLEEEIAMQQSWRDDNDKCTFIVLAKELCVFQNKDNVFEPDDGFVKRNLSAMVGDVNLFLSEEEDEDDDEVDGQGGVSAQSSLVDTTTTTTATPLPQQQQQQQAEIDIMVAERSFQGKGIGREATTLMMLYGASRVGFRRVFCKINASNVASRNLFEQKLGFVECNFAECFQQYELELRRETRNDLVKLLQDKLGRTELRMFSFAPDTQGGTRAAEEQ